MEDTEILAGLESKLEFSFEVLAAGTKILGLSEILEDSE
jgi:hypothetical protein